MASEFFSASPAAEGPGLIDSPLMRRAGSELLSLALMDARNYTLQLFGQYQEALNAAGVAVLKNAAFSPPLWTLGHVGWFQEYWIGRNLQRTLGRRCPPRPGRLSSVEPNADRHWRPDTPLESRWTLALPDSYACRAYLLETLEGTLELLEKAGSDDDALYFYRLSLFHEDRQGEALVQGAQALGLALEPVWQKVFMPPTLALREPLLIPARRWTLGSAVEEAGFAFDNEQPAHAICVPEFEVDAQPVTWAQFVEFVGDGGYDREALWLPEGWQWLQRQAASEGRRGPRYVEQIGVGSGAVIQSRFGQQMRMQGHQPAMHISWWEAQAWCCWAGRRLPTEVEWELAAHTAARRGFRWGDVWEWTASTFSAYPGFAPQVGQTESQACFGTHKVLRGASFATRARLKHPQYRNFQLPGRDEMFCGFRSCSL